MSAKAAPEAKAASPVPAHSFTAARSPLLQRKCACGGSASGGGECNDCHAKTPLQRSAAGPSPGSAPRVVHSVLSSPGRPLDVGTRGFMESRFGQDFSQVRVHTDSQAAESARAVNAHAYTVGQDVVFGAGKYQPDSFSGRELLAHELAHTVQQRGLQRSNSDLSLGTAEDAHLEREADLAASVVLRNDRMPSIPIGSRPILSRQALLRSKCGHDGQQPICGGGPLARWSLEDITTKEKEDVALDKLIIEKGLKPAFSGEWLTEVWTPPNTTKGGGETERGRADGVKVLENADQLRIEIVEVKSCSEEGGGCSLASVEAQGYVDALKPLSLGVATISGVLTSKPELATAAGTLNKGQTMSITASGVDMNDQLNVNALKFLSKLQDKRGKSIKTPFSKVEFAVSPQAGQGNAGAPVLVDCKDKGQAGQKSRQLVFQANGKGGVSYRCENSPCGKPVTPATAAAGSATGATAPSPSESFTLRYGTEQADVEIPGGWLKSAKAKPVAITEPASTLIQGFKLEELRHQKAGRIVVHGRLDDREGKLPVKMKNKDGAEVRFSIDPSGNLKLVSDFKAIPIDFALLSPGAITTFNAGPQGLEFAGWIQPSLPLFGKLNIEYKKGELIVIKGLEEATLKEHSLLGMRVTKAQVQLKLAPQFKPEGVLEMQLGAGEKPVAKASLKVGADSIGLVAGGKLNLNIPKMQTSEVDISYMGGGGRNEWKTEIHIKTEDIKLGSAVIVTGGFDGLIEKGDIKFTGKINATFPGENTAELGLMKEKGEWTLFGGGTFHFDNLDPTTVTINYYLEKDKLVATGKTGFLIKAIGLKGDLTSVTFTIAKDEPAKVFGKGKLKFVKGKADVDADVELHPSGKFTGKGKVTYKIKENLIVTGTVELNEKEKLRVTGELLITRYELFKQYGDTKNLFTLDMPIPVPGLSIGTTGLVFHIKGSVGVGYSFGPGTLEPLRFSAGFDPLEADPDLELTVTAVVKVPASAILSASITGSLAVQVDILVGSAGVEGGLTLQGDLILSAGAFANLDAAYKKKRLTAKLVAGIDAKLMLGLSLTAFARAWAGAFGITGEVRKDWLLGKRTVDTRLGFYMSAPFEYADDTGIKLPEFKDITLKKPEITAENMKRIVGELFGQAPEKKTEK